MEQSLEFLSSDSHLLCSGSPYVRVKSSPHFGGGTASLTSYPSSLRPSYLLITIQMTYLNEITYFSYWWRMHLP
jgi:hypothetical protein